MKYRKKPVIVEAKQWNRIGDHKEVREAYFDGNDSPRWIEGMPGEVNVYGCRKGFVIRTLEGWHQVTPGDWIITGVKGEHYPCKPDIFEMTYESVSGEESK